jgi:Tfp pilus assembly protein PilE
MRSLSYIYRSPRSIVHAFSLIEVVGVVVLMGILSIASYLILFGSAKPGGDTASKAALVQFAELQTTAFVTTGGPASLSDLIDVDSSVNWGDDSSTSERLVSVAVSGSAAGAAISNGAGSCWYVRVDATPGLNLEPEIWAVAEVDECNGIDALTLTATGNEIGRNPNKPQILED